MKGKLILFDPAKVMGEKPDLSLITYSKDSKIVTDDGIYKMELFPDLSSVTDLDEGTAYIEDGTFYLYRREMKGDPKFHIFLPGIYKKRVDDHFEFVLIPPNEEEIEEYSVASKACSVNPVSIIDTANTKEDLLIAIPESSKIFQPEITNNDDILKLCAKKALIVKQVDLDQYKDRFSNKNELFNLKQVIRGENTLSMRIFQRFIEAMNLKVTIILEERTANDIVGKPLEAPISACSEDTYAA